MVMETQTVDWRGMQYRGSHRRLVWPYLSLSLRDRCYQSHPPEEEHRRGATLLAQKGLAELPVSWLLSVAEEQFEVRVSTCAGLCSLTSAGRCGWMRCQRRTAMFA